MKFKLVLSGVRSYLVDVDSLEDGKMLLMMIVDLLAESDREFTVSIYDPNASINGWVVQRAEGGFLFQFICVEKGNGFTEDNGNIYCFKAGGGDKKFEWPGVEFGELPGACFITTSKLKDLVLQLYKSESKDMFGGFEFNSDNWILVS